jgi:hypothetical protein
VQDPSDALHMDRQQEIMLKLIDELGRLGAGLAFPTRTVQLVRPGRHAARPAAVVRPRAVATPVR